MEANGLGRLLELPRPDTAAGPHLGKEQIGGVLEAVSGLRLGEEQELPHPPDAAGRMRGWRQVLFPQQLPVAVEHFVQVVGGARNDSLPWKYPERDNHRIRVAICLGSPLGGQPP